MFCAGSGRDATKSRACLDRCVQLRRLAAGDATEDTPDDDEEEDGGGVGRADEVGDTEGVTVDVSVRNDSFEKDFFL